MWEPVTALNKENNCFHNMTKSLKNKHLFKETSPHPHTHMVCGFTAQIGEESPSLLHVCCWVWDQHSDTWEIKLPRHRIHSQCLNCLFQPSHDGPGLHMNCPHFFCHHQPSSPTISVFTPGLDGSSLSFLFLFFSSFSVFGSFLEGAWGKLCSAGNEPGLSVFVKACTQPKELYLGPNT